MLKYLAYIFILLAASLIGFMMGEDLNRRSRLLEKIIGRLSHFSEEISYYKKPVRELIYESRDCGIKLFDNTAEGLDSGLDFTGAYERAVKMEVARNTLDSDDIEILRELGTSLGGGNAEEQLVMLELMINRLREQLEESRELYRKKGRVYRTLGVVLGVTAVVILL